MGSGEAEEPAARYPAPTTATTAWGQEEIHNPSQALLRASSVVFPQTDHGVWGGHLQWN